MLEGKEFEKQLGEYGSAYVDVKPNGELEISLVAKISLIGELKKLALKSDNKLDDAAIAWIEMLLKNEDAPKPE